MAEDYPGIFPEGRNNLENWDWISRKIRESAFQVGDIKMGAYVTPDPGWLLCDGTQYSGVTYPLLFAKIGFNYGGSGTNFNVPDLRGRSPVGYGSGPGLTPRSLNGLGGVEQVQLASSQCALPTHSHGAATAAASTPDHWHAGNPGSFVTYDGNVTGFAVAQGAGANHYFHITGSTGGSQHSLSHAHGINSEGQALAAAVHENMHPFRVVNFFIKCD